MKCVACGKEKPIYSENVCRECHDSYQRQLGEQKMSDHICCWNDVRGIKVYCSTCGKSQNTEE